MKKKSDYIAAILTIFLGTAHTILTPVLSKEFNSSPLDFAGIGLAFMFLGFLNLSRIKADEKTIAILCLISNLLIIAWLCFGFIYEESFTQGIGISVIVCVLFINSIIDVRKPGHIN
jgi:hypothetical protein